GAASYITGSHSAKFGFRWHNNDSTFPKNYYNDSQMKYTFQNGSPAQLTVYADQGSQQEQKQNMFALYAQHRWKIGRLSLNAGLRFERLTDYFPNCDFLNPAANGECGPGSPFFGKQISPLTTDPAFTRGWNKREYSWDLSTGVTQKIASGVSVEVDYIRRNWGNLPAEINRA